MHGFQANQQYWKKLARESDWMACSSQANQWKKSKKLLFLATCPRHDDTLYKLKFSSQCSRFHCFRSCTHCKREPQELYPLLTTINSFIALIDVSLLPLPLITTIDSASKCIKREQTLASFSVLIF